jgi:hypothetical protein
MTRRIGIGALAYLVPTFALGVVWHLVLFKGYYDVDLQRVLRPA